MPQGLFSYDRKRLKNTINCGKCIHNKIWLFGKHITKYERHAHTCDNNFLFIQTAVSNQTELA